MGKFYIYNSTIEDKKYKNATIIFNPNIEFDFGALKKELTEHFRHFHQTSALVFFHCSTNLSAQKEVEKKLEDFFRSIPRVEENSQIESLFYAAYNRNEFTLLSNTSFLKIYIKEIVNQEFLNIFILNCGLVQS